MAARESSSITSPPLLKSALCFSGTNCDDGAQDAFAFSVFLFPPFLLPLKVQLTGWSMGDFLPKTIGILISKSAVKLLLEIDEC